MRYAAVGLLILLGVYFRFANLDRKVYWLDEAYTSLWISGSTGRDIAVRFVETGPTVFAELDRFQRLAADKGLVQTIVTLVRTEPNTAPLYATLAWLWAHCFGDSVAPIRGLSAALSLLSFPLTFWLCRELFPDRRVAVMAIALLAVSPFFVLYAQEARPYSLWSVAILLSSAALLHAARRPTKLAWAGYAATLAVGLLAHYLFVFVMIAHGMYVAACVHRRLTPMLRAYLWATLAAGLLCSPWLLNLLLHLRTAYSWVSWTASGHDYLAWTKAVLLNFTLVVIDGRISAAIAPAALPITFLMAYSIVVLITAARPRVWLFILSLIGTTAIALAAPDLAVGGQRFMVPRYGIPCYIGVQLALAYLLTMKTSDGSASVLRVAAWRGLTGLLIAGGVLSCAASSQADTWWHKSNSRCDREVARLIEQTERPLVVSDNGGAMLSLSHTINPGVHVLIVPRGQLSGVPPEYSHVFLSYPLPELLQNLRRRSDVELEEVYAPGALWALKWKRRDSSP